jgi:hypothetical protein
MLPPNEVAQMSESNGTHEPLEALLDVPIRYVERSRAYYMSLGYDNPYRWAQNQDVPFTALTKPLKESRVALVSTAAPFNAEVGDQGAWAPYNASAKFTDVYSMPLDPAPDVRISHLGYDREHTSAEDINSYFPRVQLQSAARDGLVGELNPEFFGVPTLRSQRLTAEHAGRLVDLCRRDGIDAAVLVAT